MSFGITLKEAKLKTGR